MADVVRMPAALAGVTEAAIQTWIVHPGQHVAVGDVLAEIETEKAVVEYAAEVAGTVGRLLVNEGESIGVGAPIAVILTAGEGEDAIAPALAAAGAPERAERADMPSVVETPPTPSGEAPVASPSLETGRLVASPIVRRLARERGIDLTLVVGTGPAGRIVRRDLDGVVAAATVAAVPVDRAPGGIPEKLTGMRTAIARRLTESMTTVPHFYLTAHCRVDRLLALRAEVNEAAERKVSVNDFVLKAVAGALLDVPAANAIWGGDSILRFTGADIAVAVAVEGGLLTPVLRGVDRMPLLEVSATVAELAERARAGRLQQHELEGGCFSVSNLGMFGVDEFSAILNPPQSGILAVAAAKQQPVVDDGVLGVGTVMTVTLSADHRVIDGAVAAEWMAAFRRRIETPVSALL
jgi:pyruvate dehydrogenase E2 component (dihydrolipoamide acetyltransferase)